MVQDDDIHITLGNCGTDLNAVSSQLVKKANDNGCKDNISVVMA
jgi:serine/threonine protein phosphatase PrpC